MDGLEFGEAEGLALMSIYSRRSALSVEDRADDRSRILSDLMKDMSEQDIRVLTMRLGLDGKGSYTHDEISKGCGFNGGNVTKDRARQIVQRAVTRLRTAYKFMMYKDRVKLRTLGVEPEPEFRFKRFTARI